MMTIRHSTIFALIMGIVLIAGSAACQGIYLDHVDGLDPDGGIPEGATLTFHMRVTGDATVHKMLNNGFKFSSETLSWGSVAGEFNPAYPWDDWFDFVKKFNYWCDGSGEDTVGLGLLSLFGPGLPIGFDDIAFSFTIGPVTGSAGATLILDSSWYPPSNPWMWDIVGVNVAWGGPYFFGAEYCTNPSILSTPVTEAFAGVPYAYDVGADGWPAPFFALPIHPVGMTIDTATGLIQWTPAENQLGEHTVTVVAYNGCGNPAFQPFTVLVEELPCVQAAITSTPLLNATEGSTYTYDVEATGQPAPTFLLPVCPDGMTIDPVTGVIEWVPSAEQVGVHTVTVVASNDCGTPAFQPFTIDVAEVPCEPAVITSSPVVTAIAGYPYTYDVEATGYPDPTFLLPVCPDGMVIDPVTGVISWTPSPDQVGEQAVTVVASNDCGAPAFQPFIVDVLAEPPCDMPVFTTEPGTEAIIGQTYKYYANAGEVGEITYTLECEYENLWISSWRGDLTWIPTQAGEFTLAIGATANCIVPLPMVTQEFVVHVSCAPPEINSEPITDAYVGYLYKYDVKYVNEYFFRDATFELLESPDGMTINADNGLIEWTPSENGEFPVVVQASLMCEEDVYTDTQSFVVVVPGLPVTYCVPYEIYLRDMEDLHLVHIIHEEPADVVWESIEIWGKIAPYDGYPILQDGHLVTACKTKEFLGVGGFRPITGDFEAPYTVEYDRIDGTHIVITGEFKLCPLSCGGAESSVPISVDDIVFIVDYLWRGGNTGELYEEEINAIMDIDGNGRVDAVDIVKLIQQAGY